MHQNYSETYTEKTFGSITEKAARLISDKSNI